MDDLASFRAHHYGVALLRISLGIMWLAHALLKWFVFTLPGTASVHASTGWAHTSPGGGWEYPVFLIVVSVAVWLLGDGAAALRRSDRLAPAA